MDGQSGLMTMDKQTDRQGGFYVQSKTLFAEGIKITDKG